MVKDTVAVLCSTLQVVFTRVSGSKIFAMVVATKNIKTEISTLGNSTRAKLMGMDIIHGLRVAIYMMVSGSEVFARDMEFGRIQLVETPILGNGIEERLRVMGYLAGE